MYLETTQIMQLSGGLIGAILILVAAYAVPLKVSVAILLLLIPFQPIDTRFGSANVIMTYVLFGALLLRGRLKYLPMLGAIIAVILSHLVSISRLDPAMYIDHGLSLLFLISGLLVFILAYCLARENDDPRFIFNLFIAANIASVVYCLVQFSVGPGEQLVFFGIEELWMHRNRGGGDPRLVGPFGTPGLTAAYFMTMTVMLTFEVLYSKGLRKLALLTLAAVNVALIIGTANRGSFLVLLASLLGFLFIFRAELGVARIVQILVASSLILAGTGAFVVTYTDFGVMFSRLEKTTEFEEGLPDSRRTVWPQALAAIPEKPWLGHGPRIIAGAKQVRRDIHPDQLTIEYPHNLYLHLLVTVGIVGTICMLYFLLGAGWRIYQGARKGRFSDPYQRGWVLIGVLVMVGFLVDELKIEFLRHANVDYAHFMFALFGIFLGWADRSRMMAREAQDTTQQREAGIQVRRAAPAMARRTRV